MLSSLGSTNGRNHSRNPSGTSTRESVDKSISTNGSLNGMWAVLNSDVVLMEVSDRLEAVLARTDEVDAANVAHLAQSISEMRGKSHGLHGIHPGILATDISPPGSSSSRSPTQQGMSSIDFVFNVDFVHFSAATLARTRKAKAYAEIKTTGMRVMQHEGKAWNPLQCIRDREVRRRTGEQLDVRLLERRTRDPSKAGSLSSYGGTDSLGEGRTRERKRHSSPVQSSQRGSIRQQGSHRHADRFQRTQKGVEYWTITPEEFLANYAWQQANAHRMINRQGERINPPTDEERKSDGVSSITSSFEYDRKTHARHSTDGGQLSPQVSYGSPLATTPSLKSPLALRNVPSFAMSSASLNRSRSPSPVRGTGKHSRQTSDLLDIPTRVRRKIQDKMKGDKSGGSSRAHSPSRADTYPIAPVVPSQLDFANAPRSITIPNNLRLNMDVLNARRPTISRRSRALSIGPRTAQSDTRRQLLRTRARLVSTGITTRAMLSKDTQTTSISKCLQLMGVIAGLDRSLTTSMAEDHAKATTDLSNTLSSLESRQTQVANQVQSALTKTRSQIGVKIADIAAEQTSTLLLQIKAVEDRMDALEYRTKSGWTHEKTLRLVFLVLEYIVMVVLWHLWALLSVLRLGKQIIWGVWLVVYTVVAGIIRLIRWLFFMYP